MACTYDPTLPTDRDWVRFLLADTDVPTNCLLEDEEIDAAIGEILALHGASDGTKYCAAALAWQTIVAKSNAGGIPLGPIIEKAVGRLRLRFAFNVSTIQGFIDYLNERCAFYLSSRPRTFSSLGKAKGCGCRRTLRSSGEVG